MFNPRRVADKQIAIADVAAESGGGGGARLGADFKREFPGLWGADGEPGMERMAAVAVGFDASRGEAFTNGLGDDIVGQARGLKLAMLDYGAEYRALGDAGAGLPGCEGTYLAMARAAMGGSRS